MKKICSRCKEEKDLKEFNKLKQTKDGYQHRCRECQSITRKQSYDNNREKELKTDRKYYWNNRERYLINMYKRYDKNKNKENDLTVEWFKENISSKPCLYCGDTENIGADRIDNTKGHTKDNVVPCCTICNKVRSDHFTVSEMLRLGKVIREIKNDRL